MKKIISVCLIAIVSATTIAAYPSNDVAEKVLRIFKESFPNVEKPIWSVQNSYYQVYFKNPDNSSCRISYTHEGKIISTQRYYMASELSPFIRTKVNEKFSDMRILGITEVSSEDEFVYHIVVEDDKHLFNISSDATGNIKVEEKLKKRKE